MSKKDTHFISRDTSRKLEALFEVGILSVIFLLLWQDCYRGEMLLYYHRGRYVFAGVYFVICYFALNYLDAFLFGQLKATDIIFNQWVGFLCADALEYFIVSLISNELVNIVPMLELYLGQCLFATFYSLSCSLLYHKTYGADKMLMVYGHYGPEVLLQKLSTRPEKYNITKIMSEENSLKDIIQELSKNYDALVVNDVSARVHNTLIKYCYVNDIPVFVTPKISDILVKGSLDVTLFDTPLYVVNESVLNCYEKIIKRFLDIVVSFVGLIVLIPVFLIFAIAIKAEDKGPVFYLQERVGQNGRKFRIIKFRSMIVGAEKGGEVLPAVDGDPRITKVGKFLRKTRMDELPQFFNILKGDMSFVGPRPERTEHVEKYEAEIPEFCLRNKVPMGLTGFAQVYGKYNTSPYDKLRLDLMYIQKYSLFLDFKIILLTLRILFKKESTEGFNRSLSGK